MSVDSETIVITDNSNNISVEDSLLKSSINLDKAQSEEKIEVYKETIAYLIEDNKFLLKKIERHEEILSLKNHEKDSKLRLLMEKVDELSLTVKEQKAKIEDLEEEIDVYREQIEENNDYIATLLEK